MPPDTGIVHQVNLEYLARVVFADEGGLAYPDTVVGTDSHTTMINGVGVLGWGVGGIEAEAAMLGQPSTMLIPEVIGVKLTGRLAEGATATDLVLTVTEMLRKRGVVEKFVEFFGDGLAQLPLADRATIANMAPEYGATCGIFPIDDVTLEYLRLTGRAEAQIALVREYAKAQGLWRVDGAPDPVYTDVLHLDLASVQPSLAGPKRPQDRVALGDMQEAYRDAFSRDQDKWKSAGPGSREGRCGRVRAEGRRRRHRRDHLLHQHLEPRRDDRCRAGRPQRAQPGPVGAAVGQDLARSRLEGRHRVPAAFRTDGRPRGARVQRRGLRLHHLHRQFRPAQSADLAGDQRQQAVGRIGPLGQPQLRGPRAPGSAHELPGLAAARRRLRGRRHGRHRPDP